LILSPLAEKSVNEVTDWLLYNNQKVFFLWYVSHRT
jgi:hypothetical protein